MSRPHSMRDFANSRQFALDEHAEIGELYPSWLEPSRRPIEPAASPRLWPWMLVYVGGVALGAFGSELGSSVLSWWQNL